ncbi:MAG: NAD(P)/FAD-dependent oxidoreductase [Phenylobacterium sp.]
MAGEGALGLSCALALADAGCRVTVCDPQTVGQASAVAAGMLAPVFEAALEPEIAPALDLLLAARNLWPALAGRTGAFLDRSGAVAVGAEPWLAGVSGALGRLGFRPTELGRASLDELAPGLAQDLGRGLLVREDWRVEPAAALLALRRATEAAGARFSNRPVTARGKADWLVIATGADQALADVAPELGRVAPIKGQILHYAEVGGPRVSLRTEGAYAVAAPGGLAVGATMEPGRDDTDVDPAALAPLSKTAGRLFPALASAAFGTAAGVRAATPDGLPMVGLSSAPGVVLAVGARRNGWLLAPLVAKVVATCVTGRDPGPYAARLDPGRFAASGGLGEAR